MGASAALLLGAQACKSESDSRVARDVSLSEAGKPDAPGWGGQPAAGGTGGAATTTDAAPDVMLPDSGLPAQHAWLDDSSIWDPAPGTEFVQPKCYVFEGDSTKLNFPPVTWNSCGPGCELLDLYQGFATNGGTSSVSTHRVGGNPLPLLATAVATQTEDWGYVAQEIINLEDAQIVGARLLRSRTNVAFSPCSFGWSGEVVSQTVVGGASSVTSDDSREILSTFDVPTRTWLWAQPPRLVNGLEKGLGGFHLDHGNMRFLTGFGSVYALTDPKAHHWEVLEANSASYLGAGEGDLAVWIDNLPAGKQRLRGWSPDGKGVRTLLASLPATTCRVVPTPTGIVGWVSDVPCGQAAQPRMFRLPRQYSDTGATAQMSPSFGQAMGTKELKSWGDFAAANVGQLIGKDLIGYLLIVRLSDWKHWRLDATPGLTIHAKSWTLTNAHVYVGEGGSAANEASVIKQMRRLKLSSIDSWATAL